MENIKIYLRLEQMRFNGRFEYEVLTGPEVDTDDWMIPTMVLQPFLENALLHGIMPSTIPGRVVIACTVQHNSLVITITDNGIGIANSRALNTISAHKSLGMALIEKRIAALGRFCTPSISITIQPACNDALNPGTTVTLIIPAGMHKAWQQAQHNK
jgi:LytS/YehU family sensor histidine kinase